MIHKTAIIDPKAKLDKNIQIGPYCIIGPKPYTRCLFFV